VASTRDYDVEKKRWRWCIGIQKRLILSRATTSSAAALKGVEHMAAAGRR